ncbi:unnamed protein product [Leuciscus chuanchicus]
MDPQPPEMLHVIGRFLPCPLLMADTYFQALETAGARSAEKRCSTPSALQLEQSRAACHHGEFLWA